MVLFNALLPSKDGFELLVQPLRQGQRDEDRDVEAAPGGDEIGRAGEGRDLIFHIGEEREEAARGGRHHAAAADAGRHCEGVGVQRCRRGKEACEEAHEDGAEERSDDVDAQYAQSFGRIEGVVFADEGDVRFAGDGVGRADGLPLQPQQKSDGKREEDGAQVAEFLQKQRGTGGDDGHDVGADDDRDPCDEEKNRERDERGGGDALFPLEEAEAFYRERSRDDEGVEYG